MNESVLRETVGYLVGGRNFGKTAAMDCALVERIVPHITKLTKEELETMFDAFEYIDPTGLNRRPCPPEIRAKLAAIVGRLEGRALDPYGEIK